MLSVASYPTANRHPPKKTQQSSYFFPLGSTPFLTPIEPTRYDDKGRQIQYKESEVQRRERLAFLQRVQWVDRVAMWVNETTATSPPTRDTPVNNMSLDLADYYDEPEAEPYILYSSPPLNPRRRTQPTARSPAAHHRRRSLRSITELPEED